MIPADKQIREYNNTLFLRIHNSEIAGIMEGRQKVRVNSWAVSKRSAMAATVRVRRHYFCVPLYTRVNRKNMYIINPISGTKSKVIFKKQFVEAKNKRKR
jgi:hypothetical protein